MTIGGIAAKVTFAGLAGPGLFQLDNQVPSGLAVGDQAVTMTVSPEFPQTSLMLTLQRDLNRN